MAHRMNAPYSDLNLRHPLELKHLQMLVQHLRTSFRKYIRIYLDEPSDDFARNGFSQDWEGLAERMGFDMQKILELRSQPVNPKTMGLLDEFGKLPDSTVGRLLQYIKDIDRDDILDDNVPFDLIRRDYEVYEHNQQQRLQQTQPIQVEEVSTSEIAKVQGYVDRPMDDPIVVGDDSGPVFFDAFVSFCYPDLPFVREMIHMLEDVHGLKLCVNLRDLLPGVPELHATAKLIANRCKKVILVLSPEFVQSEECDFQTRVALALSPGAKLKILIPILYHQCQLPIVLNHVCLVDYTKVDIVDWFWGRLAASLRSQPQYTLPREDEEQLDSISLLDHPTLQLQGAAAATQPQGLDDSGIYNMGASASYNPSMSSMGNPSMSSMGNPSINSMHDPSMGSSGYCSGTSSTRTPSYNSSYNSSAIDSLRTNPGYTQQSRQRPYQSTNNGTGQQRQRYPSANHSQQNLGGNHQPDSGN